MALESWRRLFRDKLGPGLSDDGLARLRADVVNRRGAARYYVNWWERPCAKAADLLSEIDREAARREGKAT